MKLRLVNWSVTGILHDVDGAEPVAPPVKVLVFDGDFNLAQAVALLNSSNITTESLKPKSETAGEVMDSLRERNKELEEDNARLRVREQQLEARLNKLTDKALGL